MLKEIIGYTAALFTTFCLVPQLYKNVIDKNIENVFVWSYCLLFTGQILFIVYGLLQGDQIIICANLVGGALLLIMVFFNIYKKRTNSTLSDVLRRPTPQRNTIVTLTN
jgi:MtN3 and saliva related transmembrane protein